MFGGMGNLKTNPSSNHTIGTQWVNQWRPYKEHKQCPFPHICKCSVNKLDYACKPLCWQRVCDCNKHCCSAFYFLLNDHHYTPIRICDEYSISSIPVKIEEWTEIWLVYANTLFMHDFLRWKGYFPFLTLKQYLLIYSVLGYKEYYWENILVS